MEIGFISPHNGAPLERLGKYLFTDGKLRYPCVDGILFLRPDHVLRQRVVSMLDRGEVDIARIMLLRNQDRFSPTPPPSRRKVRLVADNFSRMSLRDAMRLLNYGPVADYFAYRWTTPTYLSGLELLRQTVRPERPVVEIACGIGHFLRSLEANDVPTVGIDIVFSKLWLARHFLNVRGTLVCGDIESSPVVRTAGPTTVFCHDAFYFFEHKDTALRNMRTLSNGGNLALGHVHTDAVEHAGFAETFEQYRTRTAPDTTFFDDAELTERWLRPPAEPTPNNHERARNAAAIGWTEGPLNQTPFGFTQFADALRPNPLLEMVGAQTQINWPTENFRQEYEPDAAFLTHPLPDDADPYRQWQRCQMLDLPARW